MGDHYLKKNKELEPLNRLNKDPMSFLTDLIPLIQESDSLIFNLETVLAHQPEPIFPEKKFLNWDDPRRTIDILSKLGVKAVSLANNHTMDFGPEIMLQTKNKLEEAGIHCLGAGKNLEEAEKPYVFHPGNPFPDQLVYVFTGMRGGPRYWKDFDFFAGSHKPGINPLDIQKLSFQISQVRRNDPEALIIIYPHWQGRDYQRVTNKEQEVCRQLIDIGADYIIGHGTHTLDSVENFNRGVAVYSIGNFVFNSPGRFKKRKAPPYGLIASINIKNCPDSGEKSKSVSDIKVQPILSDNRITGFKPQPAELDIEKIPSLWNGEYSTPFFPDHYSASEHQEEGFHFPDTEPMKNEPSLLSQDLGLNWLLKKVSSVPKNVYDSAWRFSTAQLLAEEFTNYGYEDLEITDKHLIVNIQGSLLIFKETETPYTPLTSFRATKSKILTKKLLQKANIEIALGQLFRKGQKNKAKKYASRFSCCVVKPDAGNKGKGITVGVKKGEEFDTAWKQARRVGRSGILIEEDFPNGIEARFLVINDSCPSVIARIPPIIEGDGVSNIEKLIIAKNQERKGNPNLSHRPIQLNKARLNDLRKQGFLLDSIPPKGKKILIDKKGGMSTGGESFDITDIVHPSFLKVAKKATAAIPGLDVAGVDILAKSFIQPARAENYIVIEVNTRPGIGSHHYPVYGQPKNVAKEIVKYVLNRHAQEGG